MAGINVGTHVRKYNTHFDFLNADFFFLWECGYLMHLKELQYS